MVVRREVFSSNCRGCLVSSICLLSRRHLIPHIALTTIMHFLFVCSVFLTLVPLLVSADFSDGTLVQVWSCRPGYIGQKWVYHPQNSLNIRLLVCLLFFNHSLIIILLEGEENIFKIHNCYRFFFNSGWRKMFGYKCLGPKQWSDCSSLVDCSFSNYTQYSLLAIPDTDKHSDRTCHPDYRPENQWWTYQNGQIISNVRQRPVLNTITTIYTNTLSLTYWLSFFFQLIVCHICYNVDG
jgi:hypothetical protein